LENNSNGLPVNSLCLLLWHHESSGGNGKGWQMTKLGWRRAQSLGLIMIGLAVGRAYGQAAAAMPDYRLHAGDKLEVSVWKEAELQRPAIIVRPDGKFSIPLAGEIVAAGKTVAEVRQEIENRLKTYIPEPVVTVGVTDVAGNVAYVIGQVNKPGSLVMNPSINVLQALSLAGGGTPFAKLNDIIIIRHAQGGSGQRALPFRYGDVSSGKDLTQNVTLESGDVVVVP
jgi:polysaccharide export outer membrane protein